MQPTGLAGRARKRFWMHLALLCQYTGVRYWVIRFAISVYDIGLSNNVYDIGLNNISVYDIGLIMVYD